MAATKFGFLTQPNSTVQGYRLTGGASPLQSMLGVEQYQSTTTSNQALQVACLNADGTLDNTSVVAVTIAIGTNPTSGSTLGGTLVKNAVAGVATFDDLAITLGGVGYTLSATGSLTTATSNAFTLASVKRVNPASLSFTLTGTGVANASGPYRYRPGRGVAGVFVSGVSTNTTDTVAIVVTEPGVAPTTNTAELIFNPALGATSATSNNTPFALSLDDYLVNGACDIYAYASTNTGTITVSFKRNERNGGQ